MAWIKEVRKNVERPNISAAQAAKVLEKGKAPGKEEEIKWSEVVRSGQIVKPVINSQHQKRKYRNKKHTLYLCIYRTQFLCKVLFSWRCF